MASGIGVLVAERIAAALVIDNQIAGKRQVFPEDTAVTDALQGLPAEVIVERIVDVVKPLLSNQTPDAIGIGFPGIVRNGIIEDSPNLIQLKGQQMLALLTAALAASAPSSQSHCLTMPKLSPRAWPRREASWIGLREFGLWETASGTDGTPFSRAFGKAAIVLSPSTQGSISAAAAVRDTSKASWATEPCACASWTWSLKKYSNTQGMASSDAWISSSYGTGLWRPPRPPAFIWTGRANSLSPA